MTTMKQFANDSDETENLSDDEILEKPITPTEIHEMYRNLDKESKQHGFSSWSIFFASLIRQNL